jgi:Uma2 family endonuclease
MSPNDGWSRMLTKVQEYFRANVLVACIIEPQQRLFRTYYPDRPEETLKIGDTWREPTILPGFELPLEKVFLRGRK